jgi:predicted nucleotidyltransferase component of viral defense system
MIRTYFVESVKVDIVHYPYKWLKPVIVNENIRLASIADIAAIKLEAANNRGSKKDFMDVAFLLEHFSLRELVGLYREKYPASNEYMVLRSLVYFDDAEVEPMPVMLKPLTWEVAKERICDAVRATA